MQSHLQHFELFKSILVKNQLRVTAARLEIFSILVTSRSPLTIQQIVTHTKSAHFVSVYRAVDALYKLGVVRQVPQGFKNMFEISDIFRPHHHHATCENCGFSFEIHSKKLESTMEQLANEQGFKANRHHFEIYGLCKACQARTAS